ncbi:DUF3927 family protein [Escherichia coli]
MVFSKFKKKTRRVATEIKKFEKRDLAQAVIGVGVMVDFISRIMSVLADSWVVGVVFLLMKKQAITWHVICNTLKLLRRSQFIMFIIVWPEGYLLKSAPCGESPCAVGRLVYIAFIML